MWHRHHSGIFTGGEPAGVGYSQFAAHYRRWRATLDPVLRQEYQAGERTFVDYAGLTVDVVDATTGAACAAQIFVAALGASNYTYAEATCTRSAMPRLATPSWIVSSITRTAPPSRRLPPHLRQHRFRRGTPGTASNV